MTNKIPTVFISYAWGKFNDEVRELAERLMANGVDVKLDIWDLKEGHDKHKFMEQAVNNPDIDRVLIICDKLYADKANTRQGGVGEETEIISSEVYGKVEQEKFIPIIFERDEKGEAYSPSYIKSRIYIDLSCDDTYTPEYEKLIRNIYKKPLYQKPALGTPPVFLENENSDFSKLRNIIKQISRVDFSSMGRIKFLVDTFTNEFIISLRCIYKEKTDTSDLQILMMIEYEKPLRDLYIDFLTVFLQTEADMSEFLPTFFEKIHNTSYQPTDNTYSTVDIEFLKFCTWELIISTVAFLYKYEMYKELNEIIFHSYSLKRSEHVDSTEKLATISSFCCYFRTIEDVIKQSADNRLFTLAGNILIQREYKPIITKDTLAFADLMIYQILQMTSTQENEWIWYPRLHCYINLEKQYWVKLVSKKYVTKLLPLFGVEDIPSLRRLIENSATKYKHKPYRFGGGIQIIQEQCEFDKFASMR